MQGHKKAVPITQVRDGSGEKLNSEYISKAKAKVFADRLDMGYERKTISFFGLNTRKDRVAITEEGETIGDTGLDGDWRMEYEEFKFNHIKYGNAF